MNIPTDNHAFLDECIEATRKLDDAAVSSAVSRFRAELPEPKPALVKLPTWVRYSGAVALLMLAISIVPSFLPEQSAGQAFAQVQAWFDSYQTLQVNITTRQRQQRISQVKVWSLANGATRVEVPPIVTIVDPQKNVMHTLLPGEKVMTSEIGISPGTAPSGDHLEWLQELREFQGVAEVVDGSRAIDGIDAQGWQLSLEGQRHTLWVDPADNRPLLMESTLPGGLLMTVQFRFNERLPVDLFTVPADYQQVPL